MIQEATVGRVSSEELQTELFRKSIHFLIALVPPLASIHLAGTMALLGAGTMVYAVAELLRLQGRTVLFISGITQRAARNRDQGRFVLGPITLGLGAMLSLLLYPEPAAAVGIYALAFGDGLASLAGKLFPLGKMAFLGGKTVSGSLACFFGVFLSSYAITGRVDTAFFLAIIATLLEALPLKDLDNVIIPMGTGLAAFMMMV